MPAGRLPNVCFCVGIFERPRSVVDRRKGSTSIAKKRGHVFACSNGDAYYLAASSTLEHAGQRPKHLTKLMSSAATAPVSKCRQYHGSVWFVARRWQTRDVGGRVESGSSDVHLSTRFEIHCQERPRCGETTGVLVEIGAACLKLIRARVHGEQRLGISNTRVLCCLRQRLS